MMGGRVLLIAAFAALLVVANSGADASGAEDEVVMPLVAGFGSGTCLDSGATSAHYYVVWQPLSVHLQSWERSMHHVAEGVRGQECESPRP